MKDYNIIRTIVTLILGTSIGFGIVTTVKLDRLIELQEQIVCCDPASDAPCEADCCNGE